MRAPFTYHRGHLDFRASMYSFSSLVYLKHIREIVVWAFPASLTIVSSDAGALWISSVAIPLRGMCYWQFCISLPYLMKTIFFDVLTIKNMITQKSIHQLEKKSRRQNALRRVYNRKKTLRTPLISSMTKDDVDSFIKANLGVNHASKEKFSEVFTPLSLIDDMLDRLPSLVWSNPNLRWLDPCAGHGNFLLVVYFRLLKGLRSKIRNLSRRKAHILKRMLFSCEINPDTFAFVKMFFGDENHKKQSYMTLKGKFDVILGNPPFQKEQNYTRKKGGGQELWSAFVRHSLDHTLVENGYLCFVHPSAWRKPDSALYSLMTKENAMLFLEMHNPIDAYEVFQVGTRYDFYVLQKKTSKQIKTVVVDEKGKEYTMALHTWPFLPSFNFKTVRKVLRSKNEKSAEIIYSRTQFGTDKNWVQEKRTKKFKYPLIHGTGRKGVRYFFSDTKKPQTKNIVPMFGVPKVIFGDIILYRSSNAGIPNVIIDMEGKYGMTHHAMAVKVSSKSQAEKIKRVLESAKFGEFLKAMSFSNYQIKYTMFRHMKHNWYNLL